MDTTREPPSAEVAVAELHARLALVVLWSRSEPHRVGEAAVLAAGDWLLGRGDGPERRVQFGRYTPGVRGGGRPPLADTLSRRQAAIHVGPTGMTVENLGRRGLRHRHLAVPSCLAEAGDILEFEGELLLLVATVPGELPTDGAEVPRLGEADAFGIVGESPAIWRLRYDLRFVARRRGHVLVLGPSGAGKESAARAIHLLSERRGAPMVSRSAVTLPDALIEAELFGHAKDYPNAGMPERVGVFAEAERGTLFLDEIGEMPTALQARLLRVLDAGEYSRLGERGVRRVDVRVIGATNRAPDALKHDLRARFAHTVVVPSVDERRGDIPLLAAHLARQAARQDRELADRFFDASGHLRMSCGFVAALVERSWANNVRELAAAIWSAMREATGDTLVGAPAVAAPAPEPADIPREAIEEAMRRHDGVRERVWRDLGLQSRHQLLRLLRRHGLA